MNDLPIREPFLMWYNMLIHFSLCNFTSPLHVSQHHQKWFLMALIHGPSLEQHFFLAAFNKCFLMFLAKCQTSNCCRISFPFFLKKDLYACLLLEKKYWWHCQPLKNILEAIWFHFCRITSYINMGNMYIHNHTGLFVHNSASMALSTITRRIALTVS